MSIFKALIKITGKVLFIIGLTLNICMVFFGFWPSFIYIIIMIFGTGMIFLFKDIDPQKKIDGQSRGWKKVVFTTISLINSTSIKSLKVLLTTIMIVIFGVFIIAVAISVFGQAYFKKRNTIRDCDEIVAALATYNDKEKTYPVDLITLIGNNPMRANWNKDAWGNPYKYSISTNGSSFTLISSGKDGRFGTGDDIIYKN